MTSSRFSLSAVAALLVAFGTAAPTSAADYQTAPVLLEAAGNSATVSGTVVPYKEVVLSAQVPGQVNFIAGREGDAFEEGKVLVAIDDDELQARRRQAVADLTAADATLRDAHVQYSRELFSPRTGQPTGMGLPSMFDSFIKPFTGTYAGPNNPWVNRYAELHGQARGLDEARTRISAAQSRIEEIDANTRDAKQFAPFDVVITEKLVEVGTPVQPGQPLVKFAYVDFLRIQVEVPVRLVGALQVGMIVPARLHVGTGVDIEARVAQIFPMADRTRHTVTVKLDLRKGAPGGPGMYAEVQLPDPAAQAQRLPSVPAAAIVQRGSLPSVVIMDNGRPSLRLVRVGGPLPNGRVSIISGLLGGEEVVIASPAQLTSLLAGAK